MTSMSTHSGKETHAMDVFWENVRTILYALALAMTIRFMIAQPFRIPSGSMQPTLEVGDYIVVTKWSFGYGRYSFAPLEGILPHGRIFAAKPERGDVVVFRPKPEPQRDFIKRVIGLPGERIQMIEGRLHINGVAVQDENLGLVDFREPDGSITKIEAWRETLPNGATYTVFNREADGDWDNTGVYEVPEGHYFMMGDDRDNSQDSRTHAVEYVPFENLVGPAQMVIASFDSSTKLFEPWTLFTGFRGERFLKKVE